MVDDFPNMLMIMGPHAALGNNPRSIEYNVEWVSDLIGYMTDKGLERTEARPESVAMWQDIVHQKAEGLLANVPEAIAEAPEIEALRAQLELAKQAADAGPVGELRAAVEADPNNPVAWSATYLPYRIQR